MLGSFPRARLVHVYSNKEVKPYGSINFTISLHKSHNRDLLGQPDANKHHTFSDTSSMVQFNTDVQQNVVSFSPRSAYFVQNTEGVCSAFAKSHLAVEINLSQKARPRVVQLLQ